MGSVWVAHHAGLEIDVAVKFLLPELQTVEGALRRFSEEAMVAAQIKSPHVVQVLDHGVLSDDLPFIVMELLDGEDLAAFVTRRGPLNLADTAAIVQQLGRVLRKAHAAGIVHRDVKPENVFLLGGDDELFVKLIDFGIAKWTTRDRALTASGTMVGTPDFMCPEQISNAKDVGPAADAWAVAGVAYFSLVGRPPFGRDTIPRTFVAIEKGEFRLPFADHGIGTAALDAFFAKAFHRDPAGRFASLRELTTAFCDAAEVPITRRLRLVTKNEEGLETWVDSSGVAVSVAKRTPERDLLNPPPRAHATRIGPLGSVAIPIPSAIPVLHSLAEVPSVLPAAVPPVETVRGVTLESASVANLVSEKRSPEPPRPRTKARRGWARRVSLAVAVAIAAVGFGAWASTTQNDLLRGSVIVRDYLGEWTEVVSMPAKALRVDPAAERSLSLVRVDESPPSRAVAAPIVSIDVVPDPVLEVTEQEVVHDLASIPVEVAVPVEQPKLPPARPRVSSVRREAAAAPLDASPSRLKDRGF